MRFAILLLAPLLACGCTDRTGGGAPPPSSSTGEAPRGEARLAGPRAVFEADGDEAGLEEELAAVVLDEEADGALRYAALRRLEELGSIHTVPAASWVLEEPGAPGFLVRNAVAVLWRAAREGEDAAAREALEQVREEHETLIALLDRRGGAR